MALKRVMFSVLNGKVLKAVNLYKTYDGDQILFIVDDNEMYLMHHVQSCCEDVSIEDVYGNWKDLVGFTILEATERTNRNHRIGYDSSTYTTYVLRTVKGTVDIRWFGHSNGYYSESVDLFQANSKDDLQLFDVDNEKGFIVEAQYYTEDG